jgi:hypothetical protein
MSSKLFHTIVAVGIALGGATVGCSSPADDGQATSHDELTSASGQTANDTPPADPSAPSANPDAGAFCDATWPTTKGGIHHHPPPACVDPTGACRNQTPFECVSVTDGVCGGIDTYFSVCVDGAWTCNPGKMPSSSCTCWEGVPCDQSAH